MPHKNELDNTSVVALANKSNIIMQALHEVESHYKQGALAYEAQLKHYNMEIEQCQHSIETLQHSTKTNDKKLADILLEIHYEEKLLLRLNAEFENAVKSLYELNSEYKKIVSDEAYDRLLLTKKDMIKSTLDEIDDVETTLLAKELERLNLLAIVDPIYKEIAQIERKIKLLQTQKEYYVSTQLHKIPQLSLHLDDTLEEDIVETDVVPSDKT